jgi:hypothetical protein
MRDALVLELNRGAKRADGKVVSNAMVSATTFASHDYCR